MLTTTKTPSTGGEFRHEFFVRDRPDLLREIRRPNGQNAPIEREEIDSLKNEVKQLKCQIDSLLRHISTASRSGSRSKEEPQEDAAKKRPDPSGTTCSWQEEAQQNTASKENRLAQERSEGHIWWSSAISHARGYHTPMEREAQVKELKCQIDSLLRHIRISSHPKEEPQDAPAKRPAPSGSTSWWQEEEAQQTTAPGEYDHIKRRKLITMSTPTAAAVAASVSPPSSPLRPTAAESVLPSPPAAQHSSSSSEAPALAPTTTATFHQHHFDATALSDRDLLLECIITPEGGTSGTSAGTAPGGIIQQEPPPSAAPVDDDHHHHRAASLLQSTLDCIEPIGIFQPPSRSGEGAACGL